MTTAPLKIWILEIGEPLPIESGVRLHRYGQFSKWLAAQGQSVTWWTSSFSHAPKMNFVSEDCEKICDGVRLKFIYGKGYQRNISFARIKHQADFARGFLEQAEEFIKVERPDVIMAPIPTIDGAHAAVVFGLKHKIPVIADIRDLWPDEIRDLAPLALRPLAELALFNAYRKLQFVCAGASAICGVSRSYLDYGLKYSRRRRSSDLNLGVDFVFPLGYSEQNIAKDAAAAAEKWYGELAIPADAFLVCFFGTIGKYFDLGTVIHAARELGNNFYFVLGGAGSSLNEYKTRAAGLKNVVFTGWLDAAQMQTVMKHASVGLAPYSTSARMSLPNKPFEYMCAGLPVVSSIQHELKEILAVNKAGISYHADSYRELYSVLRKLRDDQSLRKELGANARALFEREYTTEKVFVKAFAQIRRVIEAKNA